MKKILWTSLLVLAIAAGLLLYRLNYVDDVASDASAPVRGADQAAPPPLAHSKSSVADSSVAAPTSVPVGTTIAEEFNSATDYLAFAESLLDRAKAGNADAQYFLYAALAYCDDKYRYFFKAPNGRTRTLDEALNRVSTRQSERTEVVRTAYDRCSRMFDGGAKQFGNPENWLKSATENDQPLALVIRAGQILSNPTEGNDTSGAVESPGQMLVKALRTKDPEVIWRIGEVQVQLDGDDEEQMLRQWAWWLVACQRGYDCEHSDWMEFSCRFDQLCAQDKNAIDFIRRSTDLDFPEIERRAKDINANIEAGDWDALGLTQKAKSSSG